MHAQRTRVDLLRHTFLVTICVTSRLMKFLVQHGKSTTVTRRSLPPSERLARETRASWALHVENGRLGFTCIPEFVPLQKYCSPIRLQYSSGSSGCYVTLNLARAVELSCLPFEQLCPRRILNSHTKFLMNTRQRRGHVH